MRFEQEPIFDAHQEEIMSRAPLVRAFFDRSFNSDPRFWTDIVLKEFEPVIREIQGKFGKEELFDLGIWPMINSGNMQRIFPDGISVESKMSTVSMLFTMGYQIGDMEDARMFLTEILARFTEANSLKLPESLAEEDVISHEVWAMITDGVHWSLSRHKPGENAKPDDPVNPKDLDVFDRFFKKNKKLDDL